MASLIPKIEKISSGKIIFTDFFDTLVHRKVHPNYTLKLWAKLMIRELAIHISVNELYTIRTDALQFLSDKLKENLLEIPYEFLIKEVHNRLLNANLITTKNLEEFYKIFEQADYVAEVSVQFKNNLIINDLISLKNQGYQIFLITDFFFSKELMLRIIDHHDLTNLFDEIFVSADVRKSKETGSIYPFVLRELNVSAEDAIMIGDNKASDIINSGHCGIRSIHTKNLSHHRRNKLNLFGSDDHSFEKVCTQLEKKCQKSNFPFSEYIIHFYFFTERLYTKAIEQGINDLFFLAREGQYLKTLFDLYQELNQFTDSKKIKTHYLKASRQSAQKLALQPLNEENFEGFAKIHGEMSLYHFLQWFLFSEDIQGKIISEIGVDPNETHHNIFHSEVMGKLKMNPTFVKEYEATRVNQRNAFNVYLNSFGVNFEADGITLVDVGWGGTMQESLYHFLEEKIPVTGYYIGLKEIYNIQPDTNRYGLNFSIYPCRDRSFDILKANGQLYEQLLAASHGSTLGYTLIDDVADTIEFHEENEKYVFDTYISDIQDFMLQEFENFFINLRSINYSQKLAQTFMTDMALRVGILGKKKKIKFIENLSKGFYQNVGENKIGLNYKPSQLNMPKRNFLKTFIRSPEKVFRYLVKIKPFMYAKGIYWVSWPINLTYYYIKFNFWVKKRFFPKKLIR